MISDKNAEAFLKIFLQLPPDYPQSIHDLARSITKDQKTPYDKALALQNYLRHNYVYSLSPKLPPLDRDFVQYFLETGKGYCTYFASAMAVMARSLSLPSRYVEGYMLPPSSQENNTYEITNRQAHAWVEIYFPRIGWLTFDPSPNSPPPPLSYSVRSPETTMNPYGAFLQKTEEEKGKRISPNTFIVEDGREEFHPSPYFLLLAVLLALTLSIGFLYPVLRFHPSIVSRLYSEREKQVYYYFQDILHLLTLSDARLLPGETLYAYAGRIDEWLVNGKSSFREMVDIIMAMQFGKRPPTEENVEAIYRFHRKLLRDTRKRLGILRYWSRRGFPTRRLSPLSS